MAKQRICTIKNKILVQGDENLLTNNEILVSETPEGISLKERTSEGIKTISGGGEGGSASKKLLPITELVDKFLLNDGMAYPDSYREEGTITFTEGEGYHLDTLASSSGSGVYIVAKTKIYCITLESEGNGTGSWRNYINGFEPEKYTSPLDYSARGGGYDSVAIPKVSFIGNVIPEDFTNAPYYMQEHYPENILIWTNT